MTGPAWTTSRLRAPVPEGWSVRESWTLVAPDGQASVLVASEPLPPGIDTEQFAQGRGDRLPAEYPQYRQHALTVLPLTSGRAYARLFSWAPPGGARVVAVQVCATAPGTGVTATATAPAASFESVAEVVDGVLRSLEVDAGGMPAAPGGATAYRPAEVEPPAEIGAPAEVEPGSTSATVMVRLPPRPPSPPRPQP